MIKQLVKYSAVVIPALLLLVGACKPGVSKDPQPNQPGQPEAKVWDKTFGGSGRDELRSLAATTDGGFLLAGNSGSKLSGDKSQERTQNSDTDNDFWVVKINGDGAKQWDKTFGKGAWGTELHSAAAAQDGGYLLSGITNSTTNARDFWVIKISGDGSKQWEKTFGTPGWEDHLYATVATSDGGFLLGGSSYSNASGDKSQDNRGDWSTSDFWIIKISADGTKQWDKTFGGSGSEDLKAIIATSDGGFLLGGFSSSNASGDKSEDSRGGIDYWVVKINKDGVKQWDKTLGGDKLDNLQSVAASSDGGFLLAGYSESRISGDKSQSPKGYYDYWVVKISQDGSKQWDQSYEGELPYNFGFAVTIAPTQDAGFILGGSVQGRSPIQFWFGRFNRDGTRQWDKVTDISAEWEGIKSIVPTLDGGFVLGGTSGSNASDYKSEDSRGYLDYWVVKIK